MCAARRSVGRAGGGVGYGVRWWDGGLRGCCVDAWAGVMSGAVKEVDSPRQISKYTETGWSETHVRA